MYLRKCFFFNENASLYKSPEPGSGNIENSAGDEGGGMQVKTVIMRPEEEFYHDFKAGTVTEKHDLFGKAFLINDDKKAPWKITNEQKTILGYNCTKAVYKDTAQKTEAWFTTQIPVSGGPAVYADLPGMVLMVDKDNGQTLIEAVDIKPGEPQEKIIAPVKGKKVSRAEYKKIVDEKNREQMEMNGGANRVIIQRH